MSQLAGLVKLLLKPFDQLESTLTLQRSKTDGDYWPVQLSDIADSTLTFLQHYDANVDDDGYNPKLSNDFDRSEEHTSELQSLMRISYAVFCLKKNNTDTNNTTHTLNDTSVTKIL